MNQSEMVKEQNQKRWEGLEEAKYIFVEGLSKSSVAQRGAWAWGEPNAEKKNIQGRASNTGVRQGGAAFTPTRPPLLSLQSWRQQKSNWG